MREANQTFPPTPAHKNPIMPARGELSTLSPQPTKTCTTLEILFGYTYLPSESGGVNSFGRGGTIENLDSEMEAGEILHPRRF